MYRKAIVAAALALALSSPANARVLTVPFKLGDAINLPAIDVHAERVEWAYFQFSALAHFHAEYYGLGLPDPVEEFWIDNSLTVVASIGAPNNVLASGVGELDGGAPSNTHGDPNTLFVTDYDVSFTGEWADADPPSLSSPFYGTGQTLSTSVLLFSSRDLSAWSNFQFDNTSLTIVTRAVPEVPTWAIILSGFAMIGFVLRSNWSQTIKSEMGE